jgi:lactoylglutathione lyase
VLIVVAYTIFATTIKIINMRQLTFASLQVKNLEASKDFYTQQLGFEIGETNPQACVFRYNQGEASFAIRTPLEPLEDRELGIGVALWFAIDKNADEVKAEFIGNGVTTSGPIIATPFGRAFHVLDPDGYKLTFLEAK